MPSSFGFFVVFGFLFGLLAAAMAFVIAYAEYRQRRLPDKHAAMRMALHTALVTFIFFFLASLALPWLLQSFGAGR
jgi:hypothetical protein